MSRSGSASTTRRALGFLASPRRHSYFAVLAGALLAGCAKPASVVPSGGFSPATRQDLLAAAAGTAPRQREIVRLTWRSDDGQLQLSGSGAARIAPPDSLRADISASLGIGRATVILTGDQVQAQPPNLVDRVLPDRFALWAVLGVMRAPAGEWSNTERLEDGARSVWRVTDAAGRITIFELSNGVLATVTRTEGGQTTSQLHLTRDANGLVRQASLTDFKHSMRLNVDITGREASEPFAPETWQLRP